MNRKFLSIALSLLSNEKAETLANFLWSFFVLILIFFFQINMIMIDAAKEEAAAIREIFKN
jgi:hypothetical protein